MGEQDRGIGARDFFQRPGKIHLAIEHVIDPCHPQFLTVALERLRPVLQHLNSAFGKRRGYDPGIIPVVVIPQNCKDRNAFPAGKDVGARFGIPRARVPIPLTQWVRYKVARQRDHVGLKCLRQAHRPLQALLVHVGTKMDVAELGDPESLKGLREPLQPNVNAFSNRTSRL